MSAGDLVISEFMADPAGSDTGKQYIELYNATDSDVDLGGVSLFHSAGDGSRERRVALAGTTIPKGSYFVLGDAGPDLSARPSYVNYGYGSGLGPLRHQDGKIGLRCAGALIDAVGYTTAEPNRSRELDGTNTPGAVLHGAADNWCSASAALDALAPPGANFGTPGKANSPCGQIQLQTCVDPSGGMDRAVVSPGPEDLVISELLAAPAHVSESDGEWLELYARRDVDLNGLTLRAGSSEMTLASATCLRILAGRYALLAKNPDAGQNGGLPPSLATETLTLPDGTSFLSISSGDTLLDQVQWSSMKKGVAWQLSASALEASPEARAGAFCPAMRTYGRGDMGTPGGPNEVCPSPAADPADAGNSDTDAGDAGSSDAGGADGGLALGQCLDPENGLPRDIVEPQLGDLTITEIMPAPSAGNNGPGEWFEVLVRADVDLNGLKLGNEGTGRTMLGGASCLRVNHGDWLVFARSVDPAQNGGLPKPTATFDFTLADTGSSTYPERAVRLLLGGNELAHAAWTKSTRGASHQLSQSGIDAEAEAGAAVWCDTSADHTFGLGDRGTPAAPNQVCQ